MRGVFGQFDASLIQNLVECRPTASAVVFGVRREQFLIAHDAGVRSLFVELVVATGKRSAPNKTNEWVRGWWNGILGMERGKREVIIRDTYSLFLNLLAMRPFTRKHTKGRSWKSYFGVPHPRLTWMLERAWKFVFFYL